MRILIVDTYYPEFLKDLSAADAGLAALPFDQQRRRLFASFFSVSDAYSVGLRKLGCDAQEIICNADHAQSAWAVENDLNPTTENIHDRRRQILAAQIKRFRPDVLYVFEWSPLGDAFLAEMKSHVGMIVGQIASPLPENRTFAAYDLMVSSFPPIVEHFHRRGTAAEPLKLAFDPRVLDHLPPRVPKYDVTFVGGFAPSHAHRIGWLEALLREIPVDIFGYGLDRVPADSPIHTHYRGPAWGLAMYGVLRQSRVTLNLHARIDIKGKVDTRFANNMRLYEAAGVGACLLTDDKTNLGDLFAPETEVATFATDEECVAQVRSLLSDPPRCAAIAEAGQRRTLADHTYDQRMSDLLAHLARRL